MKTTIQIREKTLSRLQYFRQYTKESYDEILNKLMDDIEEGEFTEQTLDDIKEGIAQARSGKGEPLEDVAKEFGVKL